ncbi:MAG: hypothetical protein K0Q55_1515 [Verrucomicrobia bacterium]|nr:hypothetical protein [Verrucomicrobiota bacterium]
MRITKAATPSWSSALRRGILRVVLLSAIGMSVSFWGEEDGRLELEHVVYHRRMDAVLWGQRLHKFRVWNNTGKKVYFYDSISGVDGRTGRALQSFEHPLMGERLRELNPGESMVVWEMIHDSASPWIAQMDYHEVNAIGQKLVEWSKSLPAQAEVWANENVESETQREAATEWIQPCHALKSRGELAVK